MENAKDNRANGQVYDGNWVDNELDGEVAITIPGKAPINSKWSKGVLIKGTVLSNVELP